MHKPRNKAVYTTLEFSFINENSKPMDDISLAFNRAIKIIKTDFCSDYFFEWLYTDIKASEVEQLFDSDFNKEECNYEVLVDSFTRNIIEKYNYLTSVYYFDLNTEWINAIDRYSNLSILLLIKKLIIKRIAIHICTSFLI